MTHPAGDLVEARIVERGVQINTLYVFDPEGHGADGQDPDPARTT